MVPPPGVPDDVRADSYRYTEPTALRVAYRRCRRVAAAHGRTYYFATRQLSTDRRPAVHALYSRTATTPVFARRAVVPEHRRLRLAAGAVVPA